MPQADEQESGKGLRDGDADGERGQAAPLVGEHGHRSTAVMPPTVLLTELDDGTVVLQGRPDGPRVRLSPPDGAPLRQELAAAFARLGVAHRRNHDGQDAER